jgi:hypothetical protein
VVYGGPGVWEKGQSWWIYVSVAASVSVLNTRCHDLRFDVLVITCSLDHDIQRVI